MPALDLDALRRNYESNRTRLEEGGESGKVIATVSARATKDVGAECSFDLYGRSFTLLVDEGRVRGGHEEAPTPLRYFLSGIVACQQEWFVKGAAVLGRDLRDISVNIHTELDPRGEHGWDGVPVHPQWLVLDAHVDSAEPPEGILAFMNWGSRRCPLTELVRKAVPVYLRVEANRTMVLDEVPPEISAKIESLR